MDTTDRSDSNLPAPYSAALPPAPVWSSPGQRELAVASAPQVSSRVLARGLTRHWWRILLIWLTISIPAMYVIYCTVQPTYEAYSVLHFEPTRLIISDPTREHTDLHSIERYLQTQVNLIISDRVLNVAVSHPEVAGLPMIKRSKDPKADLRKRLVVEIVPDTDLIRVALESTDPEEAAKIVRQVVNAYQRHNLESYDLAYKSRRKSLEDQDKTLEKQITLKTEDLKKVLQAGNVDVQTEPRVESKKADDATQPRGSTFTQAAYDSFVAEGIKIQLELNEAEALLELRRAANETSAEVNEQQAQKLDDQIEAQIVDEFRRDAEVVALVNEINEAKHQLDKAKRLARRADDPSRLAAENRCQQLAADYNELWVRKSVEIQKRLVAENTKSQSRETDAELEHRVKLLKNKKERHNKQLEQVKVEKKNTNNDTFSFSSKNHELTSLMNSKDQVQRYLQQVDFENQQEPYRVTLVDLAAIPQIPSNSKYIKYMASAPIGVLFVVLGLFMLLEIKAQRVADPEHLSTRIQSEVYALPPLPTARSIRKLSVQEADNHIEQFIQRLDHVRFAVCSSLAEAGKGRCVLITSAVGGEGKTTLAAQLAARCGNAGMSTLLIDADLRRAALCPLLDVPEGPGLSDVLKDEATVDEVVIRVQGGTFELLAAGTPVHDTSRVLQARKFGLLIAELRQRYDVIVIDSPPVLPVPDALILGRWADGAVLAARYDISRFPQVERARRQLDSAGIAVLGTVINGMRNANSYYGRYTYSRRQSPQPDSSNTI
jgi:polysaccharide biosynthesis transport protein